MALAKALLLDEKSLLQKLTPDRRYLVLKRQVPEQTAEQLQGDLHAMKAQGIYFEPDATRIYPNGSLLCHVVGFTDYEGHGIQGIEKSMNQYLEGRPGYRYITRDRSGAELVQHRGLEQEARNGYNVQLTIDLGLQSIVERELDAAVKKYAPETATVILMRPKTGEIVAMASRPYYDINDRAKAEAEQMKNRAIIDMIEPGSTFKIVTLSGVLNEKLVKPDTTINCEGGRWEYCGKILHDDHLLSTCSVHDVLVFSSNIGAAKLAMQLGENRLFGYIKQFGFGDRTGIDLPGEIVGLVHPTKQWTKISITRIPMGQGVAVTPLQMVMAMGAIANGGKLMMPQVVHSITDEHDIPIAQFPPVMVRQVVDPNTVKEIVSALEDVVKRGTAKHGAVDGYEVAGKNRDRAESVAARRLPFGQVRGLVRRLSPGGRPGAGGHGDAGQRDDSTGRELRRIGRRTDLFGHRRPGHALLEHRADPTTRAHDDRNGGSLEGRARLGSRGPCNSSFFYPKRRPGAFEVHWTRRSGRSVTIRAK